MNPNFIKKLKFLFVPFLIVTIGFCTIYTFLNWLLFVKLQLFSVKEIIIDLGIPFIFPAIPILFYLRPKLKVLNLKKEKGGSYNDLYMFILWLSIAIPTIIAQEYIKTATGKLTQIENVSAISKQEHTKYYKVKNFFIDKSKAGSYTSFEVSSGRSNDSFDMNIFVVVPIFDKKHNASNASTSKYWLGIKYENRVSNRLSEYEKEAQYQIFAKLSENEFNLSDLSNFVYLEKVGNSENGDGYKEALKNSNKLNEDSIIFISHKQPFENKNGDSFLWIIGAILGGAIVWLIMILIPKFDQQELRHLESGKPQEDKDLNEFLQFIKLKEGFYITPLLIYTNIAIYLAMFISGLGFMSFKGQDLLNWGANFQPYTTNGEWWRLITSVFLHGGLIHLLSNMFGLLFAGIFLEPLLGRIKYLTIYLVTGIIASLASIWWHDATISVGASGAIFGLYGLFLSLLLTKVFPPQISNVFLVTTLIFIGFNLVMGLITGGIDNAAHIGGLISGFVIGLIMSNSLKSEE